MMPPRWDPSGRCKARAIGTRSRSSDTRHPACPRRAAACVLSSAVRDAPGDRRTRRADTFRDAPHPRARKICFTCASPPRAMRAAQGVVQAVN